MPLNEAQILQHLMQHRARISAAAWLVIRDSHGAEDIFQNVTVKAMTGGAVFETEAALRSWAYIAARREGIDWMRRRRREVPGLDPSVLDLLEREWAEAPAPAGGSRAEALERCLGALGGSSRRLLRLRYFDGLRCDEVARDLGIGLDAVYKRLSRLHVALRECVERRLAAPARPG